MSIISFSNGLSHTCIYCVSDNTVFCCGAKLWRELQRHGKSIRLHWQADDHWPEWKLCSESALSLILNATVQWSQHANSSQEVGHYFSSLRTRTAIIPAVCYSGYFKSVTTAATLRWIYFSDNVWGSFPFYSVLSSSSWWPPWQKSSQWVQHTMQPRRAIV